MYDKNTDIATRCSHAAKRAAHFRWLITGILLPIVGGFVVFGMLREPSGTLQLPSLPLNQDASEMPLTLAGMGAIEPPIKPSGNVVEFIVRRNDTLEQIFRYLRISLDDLATIRNLAGVRESLDSLRPGDLITVTHIENALQRLVRRVSETTTLVVTRDDTGFVAQINETPLEIRVVSAHGIIEQSLFVSGRAAGMSSDLIMRVANDIFGWDIDFALEIQPDDQFTVVYEQKFRDGTYLNDGRILAAEFINTGRTYRAVRYESLDGQIADYYTPDGRSMRKQFLRAPVDFKYISSNFNPHRFHPVLNIKRAHQGVDYAAPTGTPIKASGDGRVAFAGVKGGYGNTIIVEHGGSVSTLYGHLSRYAKGMHNGTRVQQGDTIGYVGNTGIASGPHLHYEYRINGIHKNPRTIALPAATPIPTSYFSAFAAASASLLTHLDRAKAAQVAATPAR